MQHELTSHLYFELAYVGNRGTQVFTDASSITGRGGTAATYYNLNQASLQNLIAFVQDGNYSNCKKGAVFTSGSTQYCVTTPAGKSFYGLDPNVVQVLYFGNNAKDNYNSLQAKVQKSFTLGYSFMAHYTWSKGLDYDNNYFAVDPRIGYGPASFDIRHRFVMTNIWDLPIGRGKAWLGGIGPAADRFVGGWTISAIALWRSGLPFTPSYLTNCARDTDPGDPCRPNRVGPVHISGTREQYFATTGGQPLPGSDCNAKNFCGVDANGQPIPGPLIGPWQRPSAGLIGNVGVIPSPGQVFSKATSAWLRWSQFRSVSLCVSELTL